MNWLLALLLGTALAEPRSGFADMARELQAMQRDDSANPGMLWVQEGEAQWQRPAGAAAKSCADCHGAPASLAGVAARYPAWDPATLAPIDLAGRIAACQVRHQQAPAAARESDALLALGALIGRQSRGMALAPPEDPRLAPALARGEAQFTQRRGQLNLSCAQCHEDNAGRRLGGSLIPEGHPNGYPLYRLEWQGLGSLQRRLRNCLVGVRAEPWAYGTTEYVEIELYLARRAAGLAVETPAVRP